MLKYYKFTAKCGHVGKGMYCIKDFYIKATTKKEAYRIAENMPRVKKSLKNAILDMHRIDYKTYLKGQKKVNKDAYFNRHSDNVNIIKDGRIKMSGKFDGKKIVRKPKKYQHFKLV